MEMVFTPRNYDVHEQDNKKERLQYAAYKSFQRVVDRALPHDLCHKIVNLRD
jgi:hypothetical protein